MRKMDKCVIKCVRCVIGRTRNYKESLNKKLLTHLKMCKSLSIFGFILTFFV